MTDKIQREMTMNSQRKYWFMAKASGLGWSTPLTWQGWLVYTAMFAAVAYFVDESLAAKVRLG